MLFVAVACLLLVVWYTVLQRKSRQYVAHLPTYPQLPLIGSSHYFMGGGRKVLLRFMEMSEISDKTQQPFVLWMGPRPCLFFIDLDEIKCVSSMFADKPYYYSFFREWLGEGLFVAPAVKWRHTIKKVGGTFTTSSVENLQDVFNTQAKKLVQSLKTEVGQGPFDVMGKYLSKISLETICQIALGGPRISENIVTKEYFAAFTKMMDIIHIRSFNVFFHLDLLFRLSSHSKEMTKCVGTMHQLFDRALEMRKQCEEHKETTETNNDDNENKKKNYKSFLDILLELNATDPTFTMEQVRNEVDSLIFGGHDTTTAALNFTLLMIGSHPEVQEKLYAEMKEIFGESTREVTKDDLGRMTYCEAVINEALRLFPSAPVVMRLADRELKLKSCTVPQGGFCVINILGVGRSKRYWGPDAHEFRPERFESSKSVMIPFSIGKRACIGKKYAMSFLKTMVAYCMRELQFIVEEDVEIKIDVILRTVHDKLLQVKLRQK